MACVIGGHCVVAQADAVIREIGTILRAELEHIELDADVLAEVREGPGAEIREVASVSTSRD